MSATRRLAAILAADVAGYSRLIGTDEAGTLQAFKEIQAELIDPKIAAHNGRLVKTTGDGLLVEFSRVVDALRCASDVQARMAERNAKIAADRRIDFRIGRNVRAVLVAEGDIFRRSRKWGPAPDGSYYLQLLLADLPRMRDRAHGAFSVHSVAARGAVIR